MRIELIAPFLRLSGLVMLALVSIEHAGAQATTQQTSPEVIRELTRTVDGARPLKKALDALVSQYGYRVSYEDPAYAYDEDLKDIAPEVGRYREKYPSGQAPKFLVPRGGVLDLSRLFDSGLIETRDAAPIIGQILLAYRESGLPGTFFMEQVDDLYIIKPISVRDRSGATVPQVSLLDTKITFSTQTRNIKEIVEAICEEVSKTRDTQLLMGPFPTNPFFQTSITMGAQGELARDVLLRALDPVTTFGRRGNISWWLLYDVASNQHVLNFRWW